LTDDSFCACSTSGKRKMVSAKTRIWLPLMAFCFSEMV
jgi:hypothetical protein